MPARDLSRKLRAAAHVARERYGRARRHRHGIRARLASLEAEVQEQRQLNRRIAELTDIVAELLLPLEQRDPERAEEIIAGYRGTI